jgi:alpha-ketoglutarate-dependent taurine dioxygenase
MNALGAHTEAPGFMPPPKYLALYCHRQARCGHGQTLLADGIRFYDEALSPDLRRWSQNNEVEFVSSATPGDETRSSLRAPIRATVAGEPVLRFSYNLFRYGNVNPDAIEVRRVGDDPSDPLGQIAEEGEAFFSRNLIPVLIPDGCMLVWNNHRLMHGRGRYADQARHLTRYWLS